MIDGTKLWHDSSRSTTLTYSSSRPRLKCANSEICSRIPCCEAYPHSHRLVTTPVNVISTALRLVVSNQYPAAWRNALISRELFILKVCSWSNGKAKPSSWTTELIREFDMLTWRRDRNGLFGPTVNSPVLDIRHFVALHGQYPLGMKEISSFSKWSLFASIISTR